jgi:branched-chain amino acid transport system substrate-binding protein
VRLVALLALMLAPAALAGSTATPGVTAKEVVIGSTGPAGRDGVLRGADAYFKYVNARGGVNGRRIVFRYRDDGGDPAQALENARTLVEDDGVFALFSVVGTASNLAIRDLTATARVPVVFSASSATALGRDHRRFPATIGYLPPQAGEGAVYARHVLASGPARAKLGVLYAADDDGKDLLAGLRKGLGARAAKLLVDAVPFDPAVDDLQSAIAGLKTSGANTLALFLPADAATEATAAATRLRWRPQLYLASAAAAAMPAVPQNAITAVVVRDPATPRWASDPGARLGARILERYVPAAERRDASLVAGLASAYSFVDALNAAGQTPTRESLVRAMTSMREASNPFLLPGIRVRTTPTSRFPITQVGLQRRQGGRWVPFGGLQSARP